MDELKNLTEIEKLSINLQGEIEYSTSEDYYYDESFPITTINYGETAENLLRKGIGDKKQAQLDILKKLEDMMDEHTGVSLTDGYEQVREFIKQLKEKI